MQKIDIAEPEVLAAGDDSAGRASGRRWYTAPFSSVARGFSSVFRPFFGYLGF